MKPLRRIEAVAQVALFVLFLGLPLVDGLLGLDPTELPRGAVTGDEAPGRPTDLATLATFPERFEPYFRQHFGWRAWLVRSFHRLNFRLFRVSESPWVHVGRDGWLFYGGTATDFQRADDPFTDRERRRWFGSIQRRQEWLAAQGIDYLFVAAPNKHSIYPEQLPARLRRSGPETRWQLLSRLLARHTNVERVDLHAPLLAAKQRERVYERTGSHWNRRGAYIAYRTLFAPLARRFPTLTPVSWEALSWTEKETPADLVSLLGLDGLLEEARFRPTGGVRHVDLEFRRNRGLVTRQDDPSLPRAVIFHDSFSVSLAPYLAEHFSYAVFQWRARFDGKLVQRVKPDIVIEQRVERRLQLGAIPNDLPRLEALESPATEAGRAH